MLRALKTFAMTSFIARLSVLSLMVTTAAETSDRTPLTAISGEAMTSEALTREAIGMRERARELITAYKSEAMVRSNDTKTVMENVIQEASKQNDTSLGLSGIRSIGSTSKEQGKCMSTLKNPNVLSAESTAETSSVAPNRGEKILVFVSFSMPEESLKQLCESLKDHPEVTLVLRGLMEDSLEKTARAIQGIQGVFEINPELFERYAVQVVPTFVLLQKEIPIVRVSGNITLAYAKTLFAEKVPHAS